MVKQLERKSGELAKARKVAAKLGELPLRLFKLRSKGKTIAEIARATKRPVSSVSGILSGVDYHVAFFRRTGQLPREVEPQPVHIDVANNIVQRYFSRFSSGKRSVARRSIAIGLAGALPKQIHEINALAAAVKQVPLAFPATLHFLSQGGKGRKII